ncbi:Clp protease N-terminal domain-containing protein [Kingella potus]|uniref:Clp protease N-terminal domain-containing protein n=1 Tax=Kingella potus TaxID=265175 RepID=UPI003CC7CF80
MAHAGVNVSQAKQKLNAYLSGLPKVSGQGGDIMPSRELQAVLNLTDKAAAKRGDAYIASELFLLALVQQNDAAGKILKEAGATEQNINAAIDAVRGGQNVNDANAEDQRDALKKYTLDLTQRARDGKLDPVIATATTKSAARFRYCSAAPKTTPYSSASRAWAKPRLWKAWHNASSTAKCRRACATNACWCWIWPR